MPPDDALVCDATPCMVSPCPQSPVPPVSGQGTHELVLQSEQVAKPQRYVLFGFSWKALSSAFLEHLEKKNPHNLKAESCVLFGARTENYHLGDSLSDNPEELF